MDTDEDYLISGVCHCGECDSNGYPTCNYLQQKEYLEDYLKDKMEDDHG